MPRVCGSVGTRSINESRPSPGLTAKHLTVKILPRKIAVSWPAVGVAKEGEMALSLFGN